MPFLKSGIIKGFTGQTRSPKMNLILLKRIGLESAPIVQKIFEASPTYFRRVDGSEVMPHFAEKEITDAAKKQSPTYEKVFLLASLNGAPIGVVDLHKDHPARGKTYIGLLLLDESFQGKGLGRAVYVAAEKYARADLGAQTLVLGVSVANDVLTFWEKMGFTPNGRTYIWKGEKIESQVIEMEKSI
jgi:RimJ/RimL family protein N-acetyltransferase